MIKQVEGDILLSKCDAIAHGIAPGDDFKQGLALTLREQWPAYYKDFRHYCKTYSPKEGTLWAWKGAGSAAILSLFTQEPAKSEGSHPGKATTPNVNHALKALATEIKEQGFKSLALTKLSTGVGGLNWEDVYPLIEKHLSEVDIPIYVYSTYKKGVAGEL